MSSRVVSYDLRIRELSCIDKHLDGLTKLFAEVKQKNTIAELSPEYKKFAEWLRIE
jgi:hypothetical protein